MNVTVETEDNRLPHTEVMATKESKEPTQEQIRAAAAAMGRKGGKAKVPSKGFGSLKKKDRTAMAREAAAKRWEKTD